MKLIKMPETSYEVIDTWINVKSPSFFDAFRTDEEKINRRYKNATKISMPGRLNIGEVIIEDSTGTLNLNEKTHTLIFDDIILFGIIPVAQDDDNNYTCCIDYYREFPKLQLPALWEEDCVNKTHAVILQFLNNHYSAEIESSGIDPMKLLMQLTKGHVNPTLIRQAVDEYEKSRTTSN